MVRFLRHLFDHNSNNLLPLVFDRARSTRKRYYIKTKIKLRYCKIVISISTQVGTMGTSYSVHYLTCKVCLHTTTLEIEKQKDIKREARPFGHYCKYQHFVCNGCIASCVDDACLTRSGAVNTKGHLQCPYPDCGKWFGYDILFNGYVKLKMSRYIEYLSIVNSEEKINVADGEIDELIKQRYYDVITNKILCMSCPKCGMVYDTFDGCCVLECNRCRSCFCAWCLKNYDRRRNECHTHVKTCVMNTNKGSYYSLSQGADVREALKDIKTEKFMNYWKLLPQDDRDYLMPKIVPLLEGTVHTNKVTL